MTHLRISRTLDVDRSPQDVFRYLADFSTCEQWDPMVRRAFKVSPGKPQEGSEFDVRIAAGPAELAMAYRLKRLVEPQLLELEGQANGIEVVDRIELAPQGDGTRLVYRADLSLRKVPGSLTPFVKLWGRRLGDRSIEGLRRALVEDFPRPSSLIARLSDRLVLPAAATFTMAGYRRMPTRGLTRFVDGQRIGITGATRGLGLAAAQMLARLGARLVLIGRESRDLDNARLAIEAFAGSTEIDCISADLSLLSECKRVIDQLSQSPEPLHGWINNAGALPSSRKETAEGHEYALAINLLAPAKLSSGLAHKLSQNRGRLINVLSGGLYLQGVRLDDLQYRERRYEGARAYAQAKRALMIYTRYSAQTHSRVAWHAVHPGWADTPGVQSSLPRFRRALKPVLRTAHMGADTMTWLATHPALGASRSGQLWFDRLSHPESVLPFTNMAARDERALVDWIDAVISRQ